MPDHPCGYTVIIVLLHSEPLCTKHQLARFADQESVYDFTRFCKCKRSVGLFTFDFCPREGERERENGESAPERERQIGRKPESGDAKQERC